MGMVAECYPDDGERGRMQGLVMGGIALGVLAGYPLGSLLYDFTNSKTPPFLLVAALTAVLAGLCSVLVCVCVCICQHNFLSIFMNLQVSV